MKGDAAELARIRAQLVAINPGLWSRVHDGAGEFLEARGDMGELLEILRFHPGATAAEMDFVADAPRNIRFLIDLVDRALAVLRPADRRENAPAGEPQPKDYAAEASMRCTDGRFQTFLRERHGLEPPLNTDRTIQRLRSILGISSRKQLNIDPKAAQGWKALRSEFEAWKRVG